MHVAGELDIATAPQLERTLCETQRDALLVVLDLDSGKPPGGAPQRSLVSSSLLRTGENARERGASH